MSSTSSQSHSYSFTDVDVENVMRRFNADLVMIASSSEAITEEKARDYGHDVEVLSKKGFLQHVDLTLLSNGTEIRATRYDVTLNSGDLRTSRPGGLLWPKVSNAYLRIVLHYTSDYTDAVKQEYKSKLKVNWTPTTADTSHAGLSASVGRDYASNGFGITRKDFQ